MQGETANQNHSYLSFSCSRGEAESNNSARLPLTLPLHSQRDGCWAEETIRTLTKLLTVYSTIPLSFQVYFCYSIIILLCSIACFSFVYFISPINSLSTTGSFKYLINNQLNFTCRSNYYFKEFNIQKRFELHVFNKYSNISYSNVSIYCLFILRFGTKCNLPIKDIIMKF